MLGVEQANPDQIDEIPIQLSIGTFLWGVLAYFMPTNIAVLMFWSVLPVTVDRNQPNFSSCLHRIVQKCATF